MNSNETKPNRFLSLEEVERRVNRKKSVIYRDMKVGLFPRRYKNGWLEADIEKYINSIVGHQEAA